MTEVPPDFADRWNAAAAQIEADWAGLSDNQRNRKSRSARINEIRGAYFALHSRAMSQISIERLGYTREAARGYGPGAPLAELARAGWIGILSDRYRQPAMIYIRKS